METSTFHELYEAHAGYVYRYALSLCGNRADAEDITATVFFRAWAGEPLRAASARAYLLAIARNLFLDGRRKAWREQRLEAEHERLRATPPVQEKRIEAEEAMRALRELPEQYRRPLELWAAGGLDYGAIAGELGCSPAVVKIRIHRARQMMAEQLRRR